jgi:eukaryotic-like serine/threonine-protein kinase
MNSNDKHPLEQGAPTLEDPRVVEALEEYLAGIEAGEKLNRKAFLARHAEIAEVLAECLDGMEALHASSSSSKEPVRGSVQGTPSFPAEAGLASASLETHHGTPLGDFRILREIARGGMGVVYEAVQLSLDRRVALKVLPFAASLDAKQLQRFKNEAQAAAHLHHTNIVPVYAVGSERGLHFYAMQLIAGQNLAMLIEDLRGREPAPEKSVPPLPQSENKTTDWPISDCGVRIAGGETRTGPPPLPGEPRLSLGTQLSTKHSERSADFFRTVARLGVQAAEGLEYAHGMGVIHRDIKPANLLVNDRGALWITDFGLAQFHTDAGLTQTGDLLGTLRYMSPEQAVGSSVLIDHRTDVYSLGATLYELLTLRPIFLGADRQTLLNQILHEEPRPLRAVDHSIPRELETIVLKALSKRPADRYGTARELTEDLRRFLDNRPILARRPSIVERVRKWARRHPSVITASVIVLILWSIGSVVSTLLILGEQAKAKAAYKNETKRAEEAEARLRLARRAVDELIQVSEEELVEKPGMERLRTRLLESVLDYYREFIEQRSDDPEAQAELRETKARVEKIVADFAVLQAAMHLPLLGQSAVLDDLGLSPEQATKARELAARLDKQRWESFAAFGRLSPEKRRQQSLDQARASTAEAAQILRAEQMRRLRQIALQFQGSSAFREPDVAAELKLRPDQRESIRAIDEEVFFAGMHLMHGPGGSLEDVRKVNEAKSREAMLRIRALLTEKQAGQWDKMAGEPFKGPLPFAFPPFGPPPGLPPIPKGPPGPKKPPLEKNLSE